MSKTTTREQIVAAADRLFYQQGFEHTSFSDIANVVQISRGNFYHHFKSKDEILAAVIEYRLRHTEAMLQQWEAEAETPEARILRFVNILIMNRAKIRKYGCPVGTLCSELVKLEHGAVEDANRLFILFRHWLRKQFIDLGLKREADSLAMHVLAQSQGIATLANAFDDEAFIRKEVRQLQAWLQQQIQVEV